VVNTEQIYHYSTLTHVIAECITRHYWNAMTVSLIGSQVDGLGYLVQPPIGHLFN
jgi:hypothetical protein